MRRVLRRIEAGGDTTRLDDGVERWGSSAAAPVRPHLSMRRNTGPLSIFE
jgi:hypothetical protein